MSSLLDHGLIRTAVVEHVVAPIACQLCRLMLLCDNAEDPQQFTQLETAARAVAEATENLAAAASRRMGETGDEVLHMEMSSLLEPVSVSGQHVLLAAQKLNIQPNVPEHREELITATQNVFLMVVKVLLVDDEASVRRVVNAADRVLEQLSELGSSSDIKSLLKSFRGFSEALLCLNSLTVERANSLQDPRQTKQLFESLETLRRCISMLHTAMCTTIKHPNSEQAREAKRYILEKVHSTIGDIVLTLKSERRRGPLGPCGYYTQRSDNLLQLLTRSSTYSLLDSGFDSMVRDLVFHCMVVANSSRKEFQQEVVSHCHYILQLWSDIKKTSMSFDSVDSAGPSIEETSTLLVQEIQALEKPLLSAVLHQVFDTFLTMTSTADELVSVINQIMASDSFPKKDLSFLQPIVEDFISSTDRIIDVADFVSAVTVDARSLDNVENSKASLARLRARIAPLSLELADNSMQTVQKLHEVCQKWEDDTGQLQDAVSDAIDVREFTSIGINEMVSDRLRCDDAYREQNYRLFEEHATNLICHMKVVIHSVRRHVSKSDNPIYRNGLLALLKQVQTSQTKVTESIKDMLRGSSLVVEMYSTFTDNVSTLVQYFKVLREGLDGQQHPHLLSPLRDGARQPDVLQPCSTVKNTCGLNQVSVFRASDSPAFKVAERDSQAEREQTDEETIEVELVHKYDINDLKIPAVSDEPKLIHKPAAFDLLPLLYEVVTVTKRKDVTALNQLCTGVLEVSNCYVQAAKEALVIVDAVDCQTLESFRAELVSLTPLLIQTAQEMAMSSALSTESIYKHTMQFSDLINNIRKVLLPVAGTWHHAVFALLQGIAPDMADSVTQQLNDVMNLCTDVVQLLIASDLTLQTDGQETISILQGKLSKAQNNTRCLVDLSSSFSRQIDQLEGLCILWGLSIKVLLNYLDKMLGTATAINPLSPKKQLSMLSENSLRIQEASRLTSLNCRSAYKSTQLTGYQNELKALTEAYLKAVEECGIMPTLIQFAKSELFQRHLLIKVKVLCGRLSRENKEYDDTFRNIINIAFFAAEHYRESIAEDTEVDFKNAAETLEENVKSATRHVEDCLNYIRDPQTRTDLRSINDHLSFQMSDIISRARLIAETHYICDILSLEVQIQSWSAKAHFVVEEIRKQDGVHQEAKEQIMVGLQGKTLDVMCERVTLTPSKINKVVFPHDTTLTSWQTDKDRNILTETDVKTTALAQDQPAKTEKHDTVNKEAASLAYTSLFLKEESDIWDPKDNRIVQVTRKMAGTICHMTQYLRKRGPIPNKEAFVTAAKDVISNCQSVTHFIRVIAIHSLDKRCTEELSLIVEQILTITNQLNIISSVNAVTPGCTSSDEILVKNAQNLLQTVLRGVHAAETACIKGLKQPEPNSDGAEATALCFQWKRNLKIHQAQQTSNPETDELGLRKTSMHPSAPSLAPSDFVVIHKNHYK